MRLIHILSISLLSLILSSCNKGISEKDCVNALKITLQANLEFRQFEHRCGVVGGKNICKIILIPIKKELIDVAIEYKSIVEKLTIEEKNILLEKNYAEFIDGDKSGFIFIVNTGKKNGDNQVYFKDFESNTILRTESNEAFELKDHTRCFKEILNPGWNRGYLFFPNFRESPTNSYSVHFSNLYLLCDSDTTDNEMPGWSFSFDESEVQYLSLTQKGLSVKDVRKKYVVRTYEQLGLKKEDVAGVIVFLMKTIALVG